MLQSENARLSGWVYVDMRGRDLQLGGARHAARGGRGGASCRPGYSISWSGQFEYLERATRELKIVVPATLLIIFVLLYLTFRRFDEALLIMATLPFALVGGFWLLYAARLQHVGRDRASASSRWPASRRSSAWSCCST